MLIEKVKSGRNFYYAAFCLLSFYVLFLQNRTVQAQAYTEGFDNVSGLTSNGWAFQNNSNPVGDGWFEGDPAVFAAQTGAANSYILAYSGNTIGTGTISNWMITPVRGLRNGDVVSFFTRKVDPDIYPDRLQLRMSTNGTSINVGNSATSVGDFSTLLLEVNPALVQGIYPVTWTQYSVTISGLPAPVTGRFAFRYFVTDGGPSGDNSELIGIDQFEYTPNCPVIALSPAALPQVQIGTPYSQSISQSGGVGTISYTITSGALPAGLTLSNAGVLSGTTSALGVYTFSVTATDANLCAGTANFTFPVCAAITINPASLTNGNIGSFYSQTITQTGATGTSTFSVSTGSLPAGLTVNSTGNISGIPTESGAFLVTILVTDANGCTADRSYTITIGCTPTFPSLAPVCNNANPFLLTGGSPAGGVYSGTGVSGGVFSPSAGTQVITYTYTASNGCTGTASQTQTVNICTGTEENLLSSLFSVYPNPTTGVVTLKADFPVAGQASIRLFTMQGRLVQELYRGYGGQNFEKDFDLQAFSRGMYMVEVVSGNAKGYSKVILQ